MYSFLPGVGRAILDGVKMGDLFYVDVQLPFLPFSLLLFIDNFLLIIHEDGHTFFGSFGNRFLAIPGGRLLDILLFPLLIFVFGWWNHRRITAQLGLLLTAFAWAMYWIGMITLLMFLLYPFFERDKYDYEIIEIDL